MSGRRRACPERGQSSLLAVAVIVVVLAIGSALTGLAWELVVRGRAQAIADLTALAATWGDEHAGDVAGRNGASVVSLDHDGARSEVVIDVAGRRATAAADR